MYALLKNIYLKKSAMKTDSCVYIFEAKKCKSERNVVWIIIMPLQTTLTWCVVKFN